ncbi:hypothetical protein TWF696_006190 [Orbilia brochopaga]|uniref:Uncharacterized protein n=1 Tax=Orbilia brochopaga TaxID=3140254 RepID=A0AAV9UYA1_9PEZI
MQDPSHGVTTGSTNTRSHVEGPGDETSGGSSHIGGGGSNSGSGGPGASSVGGTGGGAGDEGPVAKRSLFKRALDAAGKVPGLRGTVRCAKKASRAFR